MEKIKVKRLYYSEKKKLASLKRLKKNIWKKKCLKIMVELISV